MKIKVTVRQFRDLVTAYKLPGQTDLDVTMELLSCGVSMDKRSR